MAEFVIRPDRQGQFTGVDPALMNILRVAAAYAPPDISKVEAFSGQTGRSTGTTNHPAGRAVDVTLYDRAGNPINNYFGNPFGVGKSDTAKSAYQLYEQYAQTARQVQEQMFPSLSNAFRWGGYFQGGVNPGDTMHFDVSGGLSAKTPPQTTAWQNGVSYGQLAGVSRGPAALAAYSASPMDAYFAYNLPSTRPQSPSPAPSITDAQLAASPALAARRDQVLGINAANQAGSSPSITDAQLANSPALAAQRAAVLGSTLFANDFGNWSAPSSISDAQLASSPALAARRADFLNGGTSQSSYSPPAIPAAPSLFASSPSSPSSVTSADITNSASFQAAQRAAQQASDWYTNPSNMFIADVANQAVAAQQARDAPVQTASYAPNNQYTPYTSALQPAQRGAQPASESPRTLSIASQPITKPAATLSTMNSIFDLPQATAIPSVTFPGQRAAPAATRLAAAPAATRSVRSVAAAAPATTRQSVPSAVPTPQASPSVSGSYVTNSGTSPTGTDWWQSSASDSTMGQPSLSWTTSSGGTVTTWTDSQGNEWTSYG